MKINKKIKYFVLFANFLNFLLSYFFIFALTYTIFHFIYYIIYYGLNKFMTGMYYYIILNLKIIIIFGYIPTLMAAFLVAGWRLRRGTASQTVLILIGICVGLMCLAGLGLQNRIPQFNIPMMMILAIPVLSSAVATLIAGRMSARPPPRPWWAKK